MNARFSSNIIIVNPSDIKKGAEETVIVIAQSHRLNSFSESFIFEDLGD